MMSGRRLAKRFPFSARTMAVILAVLAAALAWMLVPASRCLAVTGTSEELLIDVQHLKPGTALKYCWKVPDRGRTVRFVVARRSDGGIAAVLDACRVCYLNNLGYRASRNGLLCRFCGNRYSIDSLSVGKLSCSPFKLPFEESHGLLKIRTSDLKANAGFFPAQPFTDVVLSSAFGWFVSLAGGDEMRVAGAAQRRPYANNP
jgi:uncharacterized membrane protein